MHAPGRPHVAASGFATLSPTVKAPRSSAPSPPNPASDARYWDSVSAGLREAPNGAMVSFPAPTEDGARPRPFVDLAEPTRSSKNNGHEGGPGNEASPAQHWMPDRLCRSCYDCEQQFTMMRRRHHCRLCGQVFCNVCSNYKVDGEVIGAAGVPLRTCRLCFEQVKAWKQWRPARRRQKRTEPVSAGLQEVRGRRGRTYDVSTLRVVALAKAESDSGSDTQSELDHLEAKDVPALASLAPSDTPSSLATKPPRFVSPTSTARSPAARRALEREESALSSAASDAASAAMAISPGRPPRGRQEGGATEAATLAASGSPLASGTSALAEAEALSHALAPPVLRPVAASPPLTPGDSAGAGAEESASETSEVPPRPPSAPVSTPAASRSLFAQLLATRFGGETVAHPEVDYATRDVIHCQAALNGSKAFPAALEREDAEAREEKVHRLADEHLTALVREMLAQTCPALTRDERLSWAGTILRLTKASVASVETDVTDGDALDLRMYCKIKCIPGGRRGDSTLIEGPVFRKHVMTKGMPSEIQNPRLLLLAGGIEYQRDSSRMVSLESLIEQEEKHLEILVDKMMTLRPNVILVGQGVSRGAQRIFLEKFPDVIVCQHVRRRVLERVARSTGGRIQRASDIVMTHPNPNAAGSSYLTELLMGPDENWNLSPAPPDRRQRSLSPVPARVSLMPPREAPVPSRTPPLRPASPGSGGSFASPRRPPRIRTDDMDGSDGDSVGQGGSDADDGPESRPPVRSMSLAPGAPSSGAMILGSAGTFSVELFDTGMSSKAWVEARRAQRKRREQLRAARASTDVSTAHVEPPTSSGPAAGRLGRQQPRPSETETETETEGEADGEAEGRPESAPGTDTEGAGPESPPARRRARGASGTAYVIIRGCPVELGCTLMLRGGDRYFLKQVKKILSFSLFAAYNLRLEAAFLLDRGLTPEPLLSPAPEAARRYLLSTSLLLDFGPSPTPSPCPWGTEKDEAALRLARDRGLGLSLGARPAIAADFGTLLVSSVWMHGKTQCCPADVKAIRFYSSQYDISLGQFLAESCFNLGLKCVNPECKAGVKGAVLRHRLSFSHGIRRIDISVLRATEEQPPPLTQARHLGTPTPESPRRKRLAGAEDASDGMSRPEGDGGHAEEDGPPAPEEPIFVWSYCKSCRDIVSPKQRLSPDAWKLSFGKVLEVLFYEKRSVGSFRGCHCLAGEHHIVYFGCGKLLARFDRVRVAPMRVSPNLAASFARVRPWHEDYVRRELGAILGFGLTYCRTLSAKLRMPPEAADTTPADVRESDVKLRAVASRQEAGRVSEETYRMLQQTLGQVHGRLMQLMNDMLDEASFEDAQADIEAASEDDASESDARADGSELADAKRHRTEIEDPGKEATGGAPLSRPPLDRKPRPKSTADATDVRLALYQRFPTALRVKLVDDFTRLRFVLRKYHEHLEATRAAQQWDSWSGATSPVPSPPASPLLGPSVSRSFSSEGPGDDAGVRGASPPPEAPIVSLPGGWASETPSRAGSKSPGPRAGTRDARPRLDLGNVHDAAPVRRRRRSASSDRLDVLASRISRSTSFERGRERDRENDVASLSDLSRNLAELTSNLRTADQRLSLDESPPSDAGRAMQMPTPPLLRIRTDGGVPESGRDPLSMGLLSAPPSSTPSGTNSMTASPNARLADLFMGGFSLSNLNQRVQELNLNSYLHMFLDEAAASAKHAVNAELATDEAALRELNAGRPGLGLGLGGRAVMVCEDRITTIAAHTMLREDYAAQFQGILATTASVVHHTPEPDSYRASSADVEAKSHVHSQVSAAASSEPPKLPRGLFRSGGGGEDGQDHRIALKELERRLLIPNKEHIKVKFGDASESPEPCKYLCQVYYPVQFAALRALTLNETREDGFAYPDAPADAAPASSATDGLSAGIGRRATTMSAEFRSGDVSRDGTETPGSISGRLGGERHQTDLLLDESFIRSLALAEAWDAVGGKSGARFSRTLDGRFVIKHISRTELTMFLETAPSYFDYVSRVIFHKLPSVLCRILGVFQIGLHTKNNGKRQEHVVVMQDLFFGHTIDCVYDLKGSTRNRYAEISKEDLDAEMRELQDAAGSPAGHAGKARSDWTRKDGATEPAETSEARARSATEGADGNAAALTMREEAPQTSAASLVGPEARLVAPGAPESGGSGAQGKATATAGAEGLPSSSQMLRTFAPTSTPTVRKPRVLLDENLVEIFAGQPMPVRDRFKSYLSNAIMYDTWFLSLLNIVDYSIIVGVDREQGVLVVGIIDYMRQYDLIKKMERVGKSVTMIAGQAAPTVIQPPQYRQRFRRQLERYFASLPTKYTSEADLYIVPALSLEGK